MKSIKLLFAIAIFGLTFTACQPEEDIQTTVVDFENVTLNSSGYWNGSDLTGNPVREFPSWGGDSITNYYGSFTSSICIFKNSYIPDPNYPSWSGFTCSSKTDTITQGYSNQYSVIAGTGALNSNKFALVYDSATFSCPANSYGSYKIKSLMLTNSTYTYLYMKGYYLQNDWFKVTIKGYKANVLTGSVDVYLADFRNGKSSILKAWQKVDVSSLGQVDLVTFTFDSTDKSYGMINTPTYVCIDNIEFTQTISTK